MTASSQPKHTVALVLLMFVTIWFSFCLLFTSLILLKNVGQSFIYLFATLYGLFASYIGAITVRAIWQQKSSAPTLFKLFGAATGIFFLSLPMTIPVPSSAEFWGAVGVGFIIFVLFVVFGARYIKQVVNRVHVTS